MQRQEEVDQLHRSDIYWNRFHTCASDNGLHFRSFISSAFASRLVNLLKIIHVDGKSSQRCLMVPFYAYMYLESCIYTPMVGFDQVDH